MRRPGFILLVASLVALTSILAGCSDDPAAPSTPAPKQTPSPYKNLTEMWHPLNNFEVAYVMRDIAGYSEALDKTYYTFFFAPGDVITIAEYWTYDQDTRAAARMFDQQLPDLNIRAVALEFDLVFNKDNLQWSEIIPGNPANETWYTTTVGVVFRIRLGDGREFTQPPGASAQITVRQDPATHLWHIVQIYDLPERFGGIVPNAHRSPKTTTLGQMKAIYGG